MAWVAMAIEALQGTMTSKLPRTIVEAVLLTRISLKNTALGIRTWLPSNVTNTVARVFSDLTTPALPATSIKSPTRNGRRTPSITEAMKFSAMSRNANPTARATTPASPRNERTASVRPSRCRATRRPPITIVTAMTEPSTEAQEEISGERSQDCIAVAIEQPSDCRCRQDNSDSEDAQEPLARDYVPVSEDLLERVLSGRKHLEISLCAVENKVDTLNATDEVTQPVADLAVDDVTG